MTYLIHHFLEANAEKQPERIACLHEGRTATYGELEAAANRIANALVQAGVEKGDRVALLLENSAEYIAAYYGILKAGAITVALFSTATERTMKYVMNDCQVKALISRPKMAKMLAPLQKELPHLKLILWLGHGKPEPMRNVTMLWDDDVDAMPPTRPARTIIDLDRASIIYTSGSTGEPRGAVLSHLNIMTNTRSIVSYLKLTADDRIMVVLPFPYVYGKSLLNTHFCAGGSVLLDNRFLFPNAILKTMRDGEATGFSGVPSTFAILLNKSALRRFSFPRLRYVTQAGGAMAPPMIREVMQVFDGKQVFIMYGATEASARLSYLEPAELPGKIGSIGKAIPNVSLRVVREDGSEAGVGESGEIVAMGANIMEGYWGRPEDTAAVLREDGFHTGDLGKRDEDGFLYVVGRKRDMIKSGANRVSAREIEDVLLEHAQIHECAVIGVPDELLGEAIHAFVVPKNGDALSEETIIGFCREQMPEFKVPRKVWFEKVLPKNASGKVMKEELRARFG